MRTDDVLKQISLERDRQKHLWGSEYDLQHGPNDWSAIASSYLNAEVSFKGRFPDADAWKDTMIKAAAVIVAAIEHEDNMRKKGMLSSKSSDGDADKEYHGGY
jgi:hypothetical protein